jgi:hypothetical protein
MRVFLPRAGPGEGRAGQGNQTVFVVVFVSVLAVDVVEKKRPHPAMKPER